MLLCRDLLHAAMFDYLSYHYRRPDQQKAIRFLSDPKDYPGLPEQSDRSFRLQVYIIPSFTPITSWTLYEHSSKEFLVRRVRWDFAADYEASVGEPTTYGADAIVATEAVRDRISNLEGIRIPMFAPENCFGIDGTTFGIRRGRAWHHAEFAWWHRPPDGCEAIAAWHEDFTAFINPFLPASTDHDRRTASRPGEFKTVR